MVVATPEDGLHCPTCRAAMLPAMTLRQALFGRRPRSKQPGPPGAQ